MRVRGPIPPIPSPYPYAIDDSIHELETIRRRIDTTRKAAKACLIAASSIAITSLRRCPPSRPIRCLCPPPFPPSYPASHPPSHPPSLRTVETQSGRTLPHPSSTHTSTLHPPIHDACAFTTYRSTATLVNDMSAPTGVAPTFGPRVWSGGLSRDRDASLLPESPSLYLSTNYGEEGEGEDDQIGPVGKQGPPCSTSKTVAAVPSCTHRSRF
jgi:hypothetical protein